MKAVVLAAGYAKRLRPYARNTPKPLLPIAGRPIVELILSSISQVREIDDVIIVTNRLHLSAFQRWLEQSKFAGRVEIVSDGTSAHHERLGALKDLDWVVRQREIASDLLVIAGDNFFEFPLADFVEHFRRHNQATVALCDLGDPNRVANRFGVATYDAATDAITAFQEKPSAPTSSLASTLCYILTRDDLQKLSAFVHGKARVDETGTFLTHLIETGSPVYGYVFQQRWVDIGDYDEYRALNQTEVKRRLEAEPSFAQPIDAVIMFADIIGSATISEYSSEQVYDDFISEFQTIAIKVITDNFKKHGLDDEDRQFAEFSVRGDEAVLLLYTKRPQRDANMALDIAIELKREVFLSRFNRSRQGRSFFDVGIGIHCGRVMLKRHPGAAAAGRRFNAEGYSINLTKRIEGSSRLGTFSKIILSRRFSELVTTPIILSHRLDAPLTGIYGSFPMYELQVCGNIDEPEFAPHIAREDIDYYVAALENSGYDMWLSLMVARHFYDDEDYKTAEKYYSAAIERFAKFPAGHRYQGRNFYRQGKFLEARQSLERACELEPRSSKAHNFLAVTLRRLDDDEQALKHHELATKFDPGSPYEYNAFAYTIAEAWRRGDRRSSYDIAKAKRYLEKAETLFGARRDQYKYVLEHTRGMIFLAEKFYQQAINCFEEGLADLARMSGVMSRKREEKGLEMRFHLGVAHYEMGQHSWHVARQNFAASLESAEIQAGERLPYYWFAEANDKIAEIAAALMPT